MSLSISIPKSVSAAKSQTWPGAWTTDHKDLPVTQGPQAQSLSRDGPLEKGVAIHASVLALKTPWPGEPGWLQSMGSQRVGHNWATNILSLSTAEESLYYSKVFARESEQLIPSMIWGTSVNSWAHEMSAYLLISKSGGHPVTDTNFNMWEQTLILDCGGYKNGTQTELKLWSVVRIKRRTYLDSLNV